MIEFPVESQIDISESFHQVWEKLHLDIGIKVNGSGAYPKIAASLASDSAS